MTIIFLSNGNYPKIFKTDFQTSVAKREKAKEKKVDDDLKSNAGEKNRISKKSDFVFPEHAFSVRSIAIILTTILM